MTTRQHIEDPYIKLKLKMDFKITILVFLVCIGTSLALSVCYCDNFPAGSPYSCEEFGDCCNYCKEGVSCGCDSYCGKAGDCCSYCDIPGTTKACYCGNECADKPCCDHCIGFSADSVVDNM